jgi:hypothetical protein
VAEEQEQELKASLQSTKAEIEQMRISRAELQATVSKLSAENAAKEAGEFVNH